MLFLNSVYTVKKRHIIDTGKKKTDQKEMHQYFNWHLWMTV